MLKNCFFRKSHFLQGRQNEHVIAVHVFITLPKWRNNSLEFCSTIAATSCPLISSGLSSVLQSSLRVFALRKIRSLEFCSTIVSSAALRLSQTSQSSLRRSLGCASVSLRKIRFPLSTFNLKKYYTQCL